MKLCVTSEYRFTLDPQGRAWTRISFGRSFWDRYLSVFDKVKVIARAERVKEVPEGYRRVCGEGVEFHPLPYYLGPLDYLKNYPMLLRSIHQGIDPGDAILFRLPSPIAGLLSHTMIRKRRPYAVEVVGDPCDVFSPEASRHPLRLLLRSHMEKQLRRQCANSVANAYVSNGTLRERYPPFPGRFSTHYSSIELMAEDLAETPRSEIGGKERLRILSVGSMEQPYKGFPFLIEAVAFCVERGLELELLLIGEGQYRERLKAKVKEMGLEDRVSLPGSLPAGDAIRRELDRADLFVLPSLTEGLPRTLIEAQARALPCLASDVGGTSELLQSDELLQPGDSAGIARKIEEVLSDPHRMAAMSARNLERSRDYLKEALIPRQTSLYRELLEASLRWQEDIA